MAIKVEILEPNTHDRNDFTNPEPDIELFLKTKANKEHTQFISDTYVLIDNAQPTLILGYFTLSNHALELTDLPRDMTRRLPKYKSLGTILLCRMGRNFTYTPSGFGTLVLREAIKASLERPTFYALEVNAINSKIKSYYESFGFIATEDDELHMILPRQTMIDALLD